MLVNTFLSNKLFIMNTSSSVDDLLTINDAGKGCMTHLFANAWGIANAALGGMTKS